MLQNYFLLAHIDCMHFLGRGKCLGAGEPPLGWPNSIPWIGYRGAGRSGLTNQQITQVILGMYRAAGIDPDTYVEEERIQNEASNSVEVGADADENVNLAVEDVLEAVAGAEGEDLGIINAVIDNENKISDDNEEVRERAINFDEY